MGRRPSWDARPPPLCAVRGERPPPQALGGRGAGHTPFRCVAAAGRGLLGPRAAREPSGRSSGELGSREDRRGSRVLLDTSDIRRTAPLVGQTRRIVEAREVGDRALPTGVAEKVGVADIVLCRPRSTIPIWGENVRDLQSASSPGGTSLSWARGRRPASWCPLRLVVLGCRIFLIRSGRPRGPTPQSSHRDPARRRSSTV
jgi:hypothetical protein